MREIEFRAFVKETRKMKKVVSVDFILKKIEIWLGIQMKILEFDEVELMQFTGIKGYTPEGSEEQGVYQGDSITIFQESLPVGYYLEEYITGIVDLDESGTAFIIKNAKIESLNENIPRNDGDMEISLNVPSDEDLKEVFLHHFDLTPDDVTINGNIYDNPELLEVAK